MLTRKNVEPITCLGDFCGCHGRVHERPARSTVAPDSESDAKGRTSGAGALPKPNRIKAKPKHRNYQLNPAKPHDKPQTSSFQAVRSAPNHLKRKANSDSKPQELRTMKTQKGATQIHTNPKEYQCDQAKRTVSRSDTTRSPD